MAEQLPVVVVRGEAVREVPPEQAVLSVTASARDRDRDTVLTRLAERSASVRAVLEAYGEGIEKRETSQVSIYPDMGRRSDTPVAYVGSAGTTVTVTDFALLGELMLRLAGLDQVAVAGPWWQLRAGSKAGAEVRAEAIADALQRAREYANAVGARVHRLVEIADESSGGVGGRAFLTAAVSRDTAQLEFDPQMQTVQASVIVRVTITEPDLTTPAD
ncbi:SIMPL domain-containing protein [Actinoplanes sp. TBRC 11911]|uniref:SIMPL domain-containing protein n=1 Tax=Actinoplanes sp. TBRC 11911 TaxID=2729386 RepID=UPI00145CA258|nr:SIMPL domain-containing protein [Actinoplanes sp. TBRC 11911]NMO50472.1 SIMPL domain-containing protein [Actinoplanes sp. TBRC 11911]